MFLDDTEDYGIFDTKDLFKIGAYEKAQEVRGHRNISPPPFISDACV